LVLALCGTTALAQNVKVTPLRSHAGKLCARDRATIFEDPTSVRILYDAGQSVTGRNRGGEEFHNRGTEREDDGVQRRRQVRRRLLGRSARTQPAAGESAARIAIARQCASAACSRFSLASGVRNAECADNVTFGSSVSG